MEHPSLISPALEDDADRVVRYRLKAEEYRTVMEQTRTASARDTFAKLVELADRMATEAQTRLDAGAERQRRIRQTGGET